MKRILIIFGLLLAIFILFISLTWANLETVLEEEREDRIRVMPINIVTNKDNGEKLNSVYYLPKIKIYPTNILYPIKILRDKLWLTLIRDPCQKSKLLMLIADKQMAENDEISANEAIDKLIEAWELCPDHRLEIAKGAKAYRQITGLMRKYSQANEKIQNFIEKEEILID